MHIAICDDNIADRKQFERLIKRESDKRAATDGLLYFDSFGNKEALLNNPMQYDVFYIDICHTPGVSGLNTVLELKELGVTAPIIMCCSDVDYSTQDFPEDTLFLQKPIKVSELSESIDMALDIKKTAPSLIELRGDEDTYYVVEKDIMYGVENGRFVNVTLTDGRKIDVVSDVYNLFAQINSNPMFVAATSKILLNCRHIKAIKGKKITMADDIVLKVSKAVLPYITETFASLTNQQ